MRFLVPTLALFFALMIGGCAPTRTYNVSVRNDLTQPITVWLTKSGPPAERKWLSPEQIARGELPGGPIAGRTLPPGKTAQTGPVKGKFPQGTVAVLRIYLGQHTFDELLAMNRRDSSRVDVTLSPGASSLIVREQNGKLVAEPAWGTP